MNNFSNMKVNWQTCSHYQRWAVARY